MDKPRHNMVTESLLNDIVCGNPLAHKHDIAHMSARLVVRPTLYSTRVHTQAHARVNA